MRKIEWWENRLDENRKFVRVNRGEAIFHQFGSNFEEFETGPGNYATAIIELPDGTVQNIPAENIRFKGEIDER